MFYQIPHTLSDWGFHRGPSCHDILAFHGKLVCFLHHFQRNPDTQDDDTVGYGQVPVPKAVCVWFQSFMGIDPSPGARGGRGHRSLGPYTKGLIRQLPPGQHHPRPPYATKLLALELMVLHGKHLFKIQVCAGREYTRTALGWYIVYFINKPLHTIRFHTGTGGNSFLSTLSTRSRSWPPYML